MNIELLTKLVKLANNNPNENEANSAARRVCKMIEEAKFNFNNRNTITSEQAEATTGMYNDINRSTYSFWRDQVWYKQNYYNTPPENYGPFAEESVKRKPKPKQVLKCSSCGNIINTAFDGPPEVFICYSCQWKGYRKSK